MAFKRVIIRRVGPLSWLLDAEKHLEEVMNKDQKSQCELLRSMSSAEAAAWLINTYSIDSPNWGEALFLAPHRSWETKDQVSLASYYLNKIPFASARGYESFLSFMSVTNLVNILSERLPVSGEDMALLAYYVGPALRKIAMSEKDQKVVSDFMARIQ